MTPSAMIARAASARAGAGPHAPGLQPPPVAGAAGAPHTPQTPHVTAGHWIQQGGKWSLIHAVGPGQWAAGPKPGFSAPPKPSSSPAPGATERPQGSWLAPLTPNQVASQAKNIVGAVYQPVMNELGNEATQENAIMSKQQADNQYYMQWLNTKSSALQTQQNNVDSTTNALEQQLTGNMDQTLGAQDQALTGAANATPGNVTANGQAFTPGSALGNALQSNQQSAQGLENAGARLDLQQEQNAQSEFTNDAGNAAAFLEAGATKQTGAYQAAMSKIAESTATAMSKEASSLATEITRLQGVQISLSENNRNYAAAAEKLHLATASTASEIQARSAGEAARNRSLNIAQARLNQTIAQDAINTSLRQDQLSLEQKRYLLSVANSRSEIALRTAETYLKQHGGVLTPTEQNTWYSVIDKTSGEINGLIQRNKLTPDQAYQAVLTGYIRYSSGGRTHTRAVPRLSNQSLLNAAFNLRDGGPGLNAGDLGYLERLGLTQQSISTRYAGRVR